VKTTELYLEQVFIGFLILAIASVPWIPFLWDHLKDINTAIGLAGGSAALGLAFWLGIPFDRLADTLLDRLDRRNRLDFALRLPDKRKPEETKDEDPYPENQYLIACRKQTATVIRTWDYLRSRIRLSRALAAYGPALTMVATFSVAHRTVDGTQIGLSTAGGWFAIVIAAYSVWMILVLIVPKDAKLPRTDQVEARKAYEAKRKEIDGSKIKGELSAWFAEWQTWLVPVLLIATSLIYGSRHLDRPEAFWIAIGGTALTILSVWSWWRISTTYRDFLLDCWQFRDHTDAPKPRSGSQ
jgi:hypothetical protein